MFRKLIPWAMAALIVVFVMTGCSKKPSEYAEGLPDNFAPSSIATYPDTVKVTVKWVRNSDAEAQGGFGGYYVYCTSRHLEYYQSTTDSIEGLTQLLPESLVYFQVSGSPFTGVDEAVVTHVYDALTGSTVNLKRGVKYYFYVRTMVDGELSSATDWSRSSPRPEGDASIFAFVPFDTLAGDSGLYGALELKQNLTALTINPTLYRIPITIWRDTLIDSTKVPPVITITPSDHDSVLCGYMDLPDDILNLRRAKIDSAGNTVFHIWNSRYVGPMAAPVAAIDIIAKKLNATQCSLQIPQTNTAIPMSNFWGTDGKENYIQILPGGWAASTSVPFLTTSHGAVVTVGETGTVYQFYVAGGYYVKIRVDSVTAAGNSIKVTFHYAYQLVAGVESF
ncbi:hypothetical protein HY768_07985 [candidate division TA06 bacterium]|uniref:Uncharacterized protein n=1 Tax=candidate division TA06 bacterium TaxID=2250710 RepID=A0A933MJZ2_UNCT6|nr:hypothetical protein [candidate division TA06 bacterium]